MEMLCIPIRRKYSSSRNRASSIASRGKGGLKRRREEVNAAPEQNADLFSSQEGSVTIDTGDDLTNYLKFCSTQTPIAEGHGCKDIGRPTIPLDRFRRRYFVLFKGLLLYYNYKSQYEIDRKNDLQNSKVVILEDVFLTRPDLTPTANARFSFYLHAPHELNKREEMMVVLPTSSARHMWIEKIQAQNPMLVSPAGKSMARSPPENDEQ